MSQGMERLGYILALADNEGATEDEREQALAAAEKMAAMLGVELAVARARHADRLRRETPETRQFRIGNERSRYNAYLVDLFSTIAAPHDVIVTIGWRNLYVSGYGLPSDLAIVEGLYGVSAVRMVTDADRKLRQGVQKTAGSFGTAVDGRVYRAQFYNGYRSRLATRLWAARHAAIRDTRPSEPGQPGTDLLMHDKALEVRRFYEEATKHWGRMGTWKPPRREGYVREAVEAGAASADATDLQLGPKVGPARADAALEASSAELGGAR